MTSFFACDRFNYTERQKFTQKERDIETGLDYFLARYYSSIQGRFTSPDEFSGGPDELYDFAEDAAENPTFYAELDNPQSLNKYQYTYNNPLAFTDSDGHCPPCAAAAAAAAVYILLSPETTHAPTHKYSYQEPRVASGVQAVNLGAAEAMGGPIFSKVTGKIASKLTSRRAGQTAEEAALQSERQQITQLVHMRELGLDPARNKFVAAEAKAGFRLEAQVGRLSRDASGVADFVGKGGRTYDLVGAGLRAEHFKLGEVTNRIVGHLAKADRVVVDVSGLRQTQINSLKQFIVRLAPEHSRRIKILH